ncbi:MAG: hypothetical protein AB1345_08060 [Chloroflexota bacterium]
MKKWSAIILVSGVLLVLAAAGGSWGAAHASTVPTGEGTDTWLGNWGVYLPANHAFSGGLLVTRDRLQESNYKPLPAQPVQWLAFEVWWSQPPGLWYVYFNLFPGQKSQFEAGLFSIYAWDFVTDHWVMCTTYLVPDDVDPYENFPDGRVATIPSIGWCPGIDPMATHWYFGLFYNP